MAILGFELEEIARLLTVMEAQGLNELVIKEEGRYLRLRGPRYAAPISFPPSADTAATWPAPPSPVPPRKQLAAAPSVAGGGQKPTAKMQDASALPPNQVALLSPMVGTFYRAEKPGSPPMITVGQRVSVGQIIGIIEAMKIFSEVPAEAAGTIVAIPAPDGQLVQNGAPLVILQKD